MSDSPAARLRLALELFDVGQQLVEQRLIREGVPPAERAVRLREWCLARPHAPHGDAEGTPVDIRRFR